MTEFEIKHGLSQDEPGPLEPVELAAAVPAARTAVWLPIESAPKDGTEFQAWLNGDWWEPRCRFNPASEAFEIWGRVDYDRDDWDTCGHLTATHWMPKPTAPGAPASPVSTVQDERQAFETWADDQGFPLDCDFFEVSGQYYDHPDTQLAYDIWRAARASVAAPAAGDAPKPGSPRVGQIVDEYVQEYELRGEDEEGRDGVYSPTETERYMIADAIYGLLAEPEFIAAIATQRQGDA